MLRSYWSVILAAFGWLILSAAPHPQHQTGAEQRNSSRAIANALDNISATYNQQAEEARSSPEKRPCQPGQDDRLSDLCAQWKAADAADTAAWWARFSGALSIFGLVGVAGALLLTVQSNRIARESARQQLRPYLVPCKARIKRNDGGLWVVTMRIRNDGLLPCLNFRANLSAIYFDFPFPREPIEHDGTDMTFQVVGNKTPAYITTGFSLTTRQEQNIRDLRGGILMRAMVAYSPYPGSKEEVLDLQMAALAHDLERGKPRIIPQWAYGRPRADKDGQESLELPPPQDDEAV